MVEVVSFGCRINAYESEVLKEKLARLENLVVVNTCAVTGEAERQCRQAIRRIRRENPGAKIIVTGCAAQIAAKKFAAMPEVDLVLGNAEKRDIAKYLSSSPLQGEAGKGSSIISGISAADSCDDFQITGFEGRSKAFVQIQQGCDHRCSYCIVPFARGRNRSVPQEKVVSQIETLLKQGFKEIILTGVDACSYKPSLAALANAILARIPELPTLGFGSLDPAALGDNFVELIKDQRILPHFHLSIQSGDNRILKLMRRRHTREKVVELCDKIRAARPQATFGADFICGFPTETDEEFDNTLKLVDEAGLGKLHVFPYSERPGTAAAAMEQLPAAIRKARAEKLRILSKEN